MPHIEIQHFPIELGPQARTSLAKGLTALICQHFGVTPMAVSIALVPVAPSEWQHDVHLPHILGRGPQLLQAPLLYQNQMQDVPVAP